MAPSTSITRPFNDNFLLTYSAEHICYEIDMFFYTVEVRHQPSFSSIANTGNANNVFIESFVTHLRNIIEFLYKNPRPSDIAASDFYDSGSWESMRPPITSTLEHAKLRANKEMAHITTDRIAGGPPQKVWDFDGLANEIRDILLFFASNAKPTRLSPSVVKNIR